MSSEGYVDDFKLITYKRKKKTSSCNLRKPIGNNPPDRNSTDKQRLIQRVEEAKTELKSSDLFASALASLREGFSSLSYPAIHEIICFGLGKIGECLISRYQFAFLLCLKDIYKTEVRVYDPVFTKFDSWLLEFFGCITLENNSEGKFKISDQKTRIFYLPHCPKQLTNNLLWANWGLNLNYCIIIANSFNLIVEKTPKRDLNKSGQYIVNIIPHMVELALINSFRLYEIFNDTAIHIFPLNKINLLTDDFWAFNSEPVYSDDDIEFITNKIELDLTFQKDNGF